MLCFSLFFYSVPSCMLYIYYVDYHMRYFHFLFIVFLYFFSIGFLHNFHLFSFVFVFHLITTTSVSSFLIWFTNNNYFYIYIYISYIENSRAFHKTTLRVKTALQYGINPKWQTIPPFPSAHVYTPYRDGGERKLFDSSPECLVFVLRRYRSWERDNCRFVCVFVLGEMFYQFHFL